MRFLTPILLQFSLILTTLGAPEIVLAESRRDLTRSARRALSSLYKSTPGAAELGNHAAGILVFPTIMKGGFIVAAHYGDGVLFKGDSVVGYYNSTGGSWGLQAGAQKFSYVLFFMTQDDLRYLDQSAGWEIGTSPNLTVLDKGLATSLSSTTLRKGVYAFFFGQKGLMAGLSLQGTKITRKD